MWALNSWLKKLWKTMLKTLWKTDISYTDSAEGILEKVFNNLNYLDLSPTTP